MDIRLPHAWRPRVYQERLWAYLSGGGKRAVITWPRRSGKDAVLLHHCACAAFERVQNLWYCLPKYGQARKALWTAVNPHTGKRRLDEVFPPAIRSGTNEQEMRIELGNGSTFQLIGSDSYDSLVGATPGGVVFSEYALSDPAAWGHIRPILLEANGWAVFNSTPRGKNHHYDLYRMAMDSDEWFAELLTNDDTRVFSKEQLAEELKEMIASNGESYGKALWEQEYFCSFESAPVGAVYGDEVRAAVADGRIMRVPVEGAKAVDVFFDLGRADKTAAWFVQQVGLEFRLIDFMEDRGRPWSFYLKELSKRNYLYGDICLPHDSNHKQLASERTIEQQTRDAGFRTRVIPISSVDAGIESARLIFNRCVFDERRCESGIAALKAYRYEVNDNGTWSNRPLHDENSHAADAFRYFASSYREAPRKRKSFSEAVVSWMG